MSIIDKLSPYAIVAKVAGVLLLAFAVFQFFMSWNARGQEIDALKQWQNGVVIATTNATVVPDAKGVRKPLATDQIVLAIDGLSRSYASCHNASEEANRRAAEATTRSTIADQALANLNASLGQQYKTATARISDLEKRQAALTPAAQCARMTSDSTAAWDGWK